RAFVNGLDSEHAPFEALFPGTTVYADRLPKFKTSTPGLKLRIDRLYEKVSELPNKLHLDFWAVLQMSKGQYQTSRIIVWSSAVMVIGMLCGLTVLFHPLVLSPVRSLQ